MENGLGVEGEAEAEGEEVVVVVGEAAVEAVSYKECNCL